MTGIGQAWQEIQLWGIVMALGVVSIGAALWWQILTRPRAPQSGPPLPLCARCGHAHVAHQHYRAGDECGLCPCPSYIFRRDTPAQHV